MSMLYLRNKPIGAISDGASGGGHVIENTSGTDMEQRSDLQFVGVYTEDDSANDRTKVNVVRTMTKAQMDALSAAEKVGFIRTSDEADNPYQYTDASDVSYGSTTVEDALDDLSEDLAKLTIKTETQSVTTSAAGTFIITKPTGAKAFWVIDTDKYATSYFVRYREHVYGIFEYAAPHEPYQGALTVTVQYI